MSKPHGIRYDASKYGRDHGADTVCKLRFPYMIVVPGGVCSLYIVHCLDKVIDLNRDDNREIRSDYGKAA